MVKKPVLDIPTKDVIRAVSVRTLLSVSEDVKAPAAARAAAARTLLESLGDIGRLQNRQRQTDKPLSELTSGELDEELRRLSEKEDHQPDDEDQD
jgi:hypothetical protein